MGYGGGNEGKCRSLGVLIDLKTTVCAQQHKCGERGGNTQHITALFGNTTLVILFSARVILTS